MLHISQVIHRVIGILTWPMPPEAPNTTAEYQSQLSRLNVRIRLAFDTSFHHDDRGFQGGVWIFLQRKAIWIWIIDIRTMLSGRRRNRQLSPEDLDVSKYGTS